MTHAPHDRIARALSPRASISLSRRRRTRAGSTPSSAARAMYTVKVGPLVSCDCPDAAKGNVCKHQLFVMLKVLRAAESSNSSTSALAPARACESSFPRAARRGRRRLPRRRCGATPEATGKSKAPAERGGGGAAAQLGLSRCVSKRSEPRSARCASRATTAFTPSASGCGCAPRAPPPSRARSAARRGPRRRRVSGRVGAEGCQSRARGGRVVIPPVVQRLAEPPLLGRVLDGEE